MDSELLAKIKKLPPAVRAELEKEEFLNKVDALSKQYGVKGILILLKVIFGELPEAGLTGYLMSEYGLNEFLAGEIKAKIASLIKLLPQAPAPAATLKRPASAALPMTFSREDEEEIKKLKITTAPKPPVDYAAAADQIIAASGISGLTEILAKRLSNIIVSRLRDVRDDLETAEILMKDRKVGGLALTETQADALLKLIKTGQPAEPIDETAAYGSEAKVPSNLPIDLDFGEETEEELPENLPAEAPDHELLVVEDEDGLPVLKMPAAAASKGIADVQKPSQKLSEAPQNVKMDTRMPDAADSRARQSFVGSAAPAVSSERLTAKEKSLPPPQPAPFISDKKIPESVLATRQERRPSFDGVKFEKKLVGPIDELANMTLIDFRRLAADPQGAVAKVKEKIELLGQDGFSQRMAGINAWHDNEVNKFYRLLGQASMSEGRPIEEIIKERLLAGKPTLSIDELEAIIELNKALRF